MKNETGKYSKRVWLNRLSLMCLLHFVSCW